MRYGKCFLSGKWGPVERHHIFGGALRSKSEKYGLVVELSPWMHREGPEAAHRCGETARYLKRIAQKKCMIEQKWNLDRWLAEFGKNYLDEDELAEIEDIILMGEEIEPEGWIKEEPWTDGELWGAEAIADADWYDGRPDEGERQCKRTGETVHAQKGFRVTLEVLPF